MLSANERAGRPGILVVWSAALTVSAARQLKLVCVLLLQHVSMYFCAVVLAAPQLAPVSSPGRDAH